MSIVAHNKTEVTLKIKDYYVWDPIQKSGYYGVLEYAILPGGEKTIPSSVFTKKSMEEMRTQEIHVKSGGSTLLVLFHEDFENKEVFFEMGDDDVLGARFVHRKAGKTRVRRIWCSFFCSRSLPPLKLID